MNDELHRWRLAGAHASAGTSTSPIRRKAIDRIEQAGLHGAVLDFGAGDGDLTREIKARGSFSRVIGVDLVAFADRHLNDGIEWIEHDLNDRLPLGDCELDAILAVEVIEHLENPRFVAREWRRLLKPGGLLIGTMPNNESWRSLVSLAARGHFTAFVGQGYPAHITALLREDLMRVLDEAGFGSIDFFYSDRGAIPKLTSVTWQQLSAGSLRGRRFSDNLGWSARRR